MFVMPNLKIMKRFRYSSELGCTEWQFTVCHFFSLRWRFDIPLLGNCVPRVDGNYCLFNGATIELLGCRNADDGGRYSDCDLRVSSSSVGAQLTWFEIDVLLFDEQFLSIRRLFLCSTCLVSFVRPLVAHYSIARIIVVLS